MHAAPSHLLYLHGFRSSPQSSKARQMEAWVRQHGPELHWYCPQLPVSPAQAMREVFAAIDTWPRERMAVIGSSLGGFYAHVVAEATGCPAVLLNPAVHAERDLASQVGSHSSWHSPQDHIDFTAAHVQELVAMKPTRPTLLDRYALVIAKGDEVLDWREMAQHFAGATQRLLDAGDHALSDFEQAHLPFVLHFLKLLKEDAHGQNPRADQT